MKNPPRKATHTESSLFAVCMIVLWAVAIVLMVPHLWEAVAYVVRHII